MRVPDWTPRLLRRAGVAATRLPQGGPWLVQRAEAAVRSQRLAEGAWLVEQEDAGKRHRVVRLGKEEDEAFLITPAGRPRHRQMHRREMALAKHLGEEHIAWVLRWLKINCVIDVGANRGQYAQRLRKAGYGGRIVSFEPLPKYVKVLEAKAADDPDWTIFPFALGREEGTTEINVTGTLSSMLDSSSFGKEWHAGLRDEERHATQEIAVRRLEDLYDEVVAGLESPRVYLKLDTQGFDLEAFAGAGPCVERVLGMQSEVSMVPLYEGMPRFPQQLATYEAAGFETTGLFPVIRHPPTMRMIEYDIVMVRPQQAP